MKKIILTFLLLFIGFVAFAQTPEEKAEFMTAQINTLLPNLEPFQKATIKMGTMRYFKREAEINNSIEGIQITQAELNEKIIPRRAKIKEVYTTRMKDRLTPQQYALFMQNIESFLTNVRNEFGE